MCRKTLWGIGMMGLAAVAAGCARQYVDLLQTAAGVQPVIIQVLCPNETTVSVTVIPPRVPVRRGRDSVLWAIVGPNGTEARIEPKIANQWPFNNPPPPLVATPGAPARSGTAGPDSRPGSYAYAVIAQCQVPGGGPLITITIDPDVIITE